MLRIVQDEGTINMFRLIVDPHSFGRSVENLFYLSCLFDDGACGFHIDEDGVPIVGVSLYLKQFYDLTPSSGSYIGL
jgi:hypothetical protein